MGDKKTIYDDIYVAIAEDAGVTLDSKHQLSVDEIEAMAVALEKRVSRCNEAKERSVAAVEKIGSVSENLAADAIGISGKNLSFDDIKSDFAKSLMENCLAARSDRRSPSR